MRQFMHNSVNISKFTILLKAPNILLVATTGNTV